MNWLNNRLSYAYVTYVQTNPADPDVNMHVTVSQAKIKARPSFRGARSVLKFLAHDLAIFYS